MSAEPRRVSGAERPPTPDHRSSNPTARPRMGEWRLLDVAEPLWSPAGLAPSRSLLTLDGRGLPRAKLKIRCQNSSGRLRSRSICAPKAVGWTRPGEWTPGWTAGAMSEYGCDALPGMMKLPHSYLHPSRLCARSAGAPSTCDSLTPAVRQWRQRGLAAAVLVPSVGRTGGYCSCGLLS